MGAIDIGRKYNETFKNALIEARKIQFRDDWWKPECEIEEMNLDQYRKYTTIFDCYRYGKYFDDDNWWKDRYDYHRDNDTVKKLNDKFEKLVGPEFTKAYEYFRKRANSKEPEWGGDVRYKNLSYDQGYEMSLFLEAYVLMSLLKTAKSFDDHLNIVTQHIHCYWDIVEDHEKDEKLKEEIIDKVIRNDWENPIDIRAIHKANNERVYAINKKRKEKQL